VTEARFGENLEYSTHAAAIYISSTANQLLASLVVGLEKRPQTGRHRHGIIFCPRYLCLDMWARGH
jgi:hypothetical protein